MTIASTGSQEPKVSWEQAFEQFHRLVHYAANTHKRDGIVDTAVCADDLYQEGIIKLYDCWREWCVDKGKDMDEFAPIFRTSLWRAVKRGGGRQNNYLDIDKATDKAIDTSSRPEDSIDRLDLEEKLTVLHQHLSQNARLLLNEIMEPSIRTLFEALADFKRKEMIKSQGKRVNIPKDTSVKMKHIQKSLGFTGKQYDNAILELKNRTKEIWGYLPSR